MRARLASRLRQTEGALNSLTHLIEAAPFPMWYRGPDLKLGLVNSSFVDAVEGRDAADVIERCSELVEEGAMEAAREAQETGRIVSRMQPAILRGETAGLLRAQSAATEPYVLQRPGPVPSQERCGRGTPAVTAPRSPGG